MFQWRTGKEVLFLKFVFQMFSWLWVIALVVDGSRCGDVSRAFSMLPGLKKVFLLCGLEGYMVVTIGRVPSLQFFHSTSLLPFVADYGSKLWHAASRLRLYVLLMSCLAQTPVRDPKIHLRTRVTLDLLLSSSCRV